MVTDIKELLILPPLACGRFGSSPTPMDNYEVQIDIDAPGSYRKLVPAETLVVDAPTGEIREAVMPPTVRFRDENGLIRPVAPFFEVWARFADDEAFAPLTMTHLTELGLAPADVRWRVRVANHKAFRRTGDPHDQVEADSELFGTHIAQPLHGKAVHFAAGCSIPLGSVQYIKPTDAYPEIRLRFTPAAGKVYGCANAEPGAPGDPNVAASVYDGTRGSWAKYSDVTSTYPLTEPPGMFPVTMNADPKLIVSRGYLDDSCDGLITVELAVHGTTLSARARIAVGPPDFAPDSFHVRVAADELEQILLGPQVEPGVTVQEVADLLRRGLETQRLMNTELLNGIKLLDQNGNVSPSAFAAPDEANYAHAMFRHINVLTTLPGLDASPDAAAHAAAFGMLQRILAYTRTHEQVGDFTGAGRRLMPPLMRGSDFRMLALTRRQRSRIEQALRDHTPPAPLPQQET